MLTEVEHSVEVVWKIMKNFEKYSMKIQFYWRPWCRRRDERVAGADRNGVRPVCPNHRSLHTPHLVIYLKIHQRPLATSVLYAPSDCISVGAQARAAEWRAQPDAHTGALQCATRVRSPSDSRSAARRRRRIASLAVSEPVLESSAARSRAPLRVPLS